jgi:hypothetical protein
MLSAGGRVALITLIVGSSLLYSLFLTETPSALFDFNGGLYHAGAAILHGADPYRAGFLHHQAAIMRAGGVAQGENSQHAFSVPLYPAPANLAVVPLSLLPFWLAGGLFTVLSIGAIILALRLFGVRDWRCHALVLASWPSLFALYLGAMGPLLLLGAAVAWRWRERLWPPALAVAAVIAAKLFPWPLAVWLLVTRRLRTFALTVAIGLVATLGAWAVIGFAGLMQYPQMLSDATFIQEGRASSLAAVLLAAGCSVAAAHLLALLAAAALLGLAWRVAQRPDGDRQAFGLAVIAALTASPIVWDHYMVLLFVPIALASPRFSGLWLAPLCTPLILVIGEAVSRTPHTVGASNAASVRAAIVWLMLQALVTVRLCRPRRPAALPSTAAPLQPPGAVAWAGPA